MATVKKFAASSFKTGSNQSYGQAWCKECNWLLLGRTGEVPKICKAAKKHSENTGHKTLIDITRQRGYEARPQA